MHPPKFQLSVAQGTEAVLIHALHELFFHEVVKIFSHISNQYTKEKVQDDRKGGLEGRGLKWQEECREKSEKKGMETGLLCDIVLSYGLTTSESTPACQFQEFGRLCFQIKLFQRNIISIKHASMYFLVECWLSEEGIGQILHGLSD